MSDDYMQGWNEYTEVTRETAVYPGFDADPYSTNTMRTDATLYTTLGLSGEVGEVVDVVKKQWRRRGYIDTSDIDFREKLIDELGDVFWYMARLMDEVGLSVDVVIGDNVTKLKARKEAGTLKERPKND